jgi:hypothetical protein
MLTSVHPKLPMRDKLITRKFYIDNLGFTDIGRIDFEGYLILQKDNIEIHFFEFKELDPKENYGQVYIRTNDIDKLYKTILTIKQTIHLVGNLQIKSWAQKEFSILDPDHNLLTFGQSL